LSQILKPDSSDKIERLRALLKATPHDTMTALALGEAHLRQGQDLEALLIYQEIASQCRVADVHLAMAQIYSEHGHFHQAIAELRKLLALEPGNVEARLILEELKTKQELPNEVLAYLTPAPDCNAVEQARERLSIQRTLLRVEVQSLKKKAEIVPGQPVLLYYASEAEKRLRRIEERLVRLQSLAERQQVRPRLASHLLPLIQLKGVESLTLLSRTGELLEHSGKTPVSAETLRGWLLDALEFLDAYPDKPKNWVLKCQKGVVLMEVVAANYVLMVVTNEKLNFGTLRFTAARVVAQLAKQLRGC
jgi:predicted regulator of Ras-like GTPase activity (Roadblock/LC7/MglB family)